MRVVRELQERTGGFTEFVPLSFIPFHTLLGRTHGIEEISREENLKHTAAFRLALGRSVPNLQASWVKMGLDAATEALRWGVNDLGGTLMEEIDLAAWPAPTTASASSPADLIAAAHAAGRPAAERTTLYEIRRALRAGGRGVTELLLGPALRYAGETDATDLGRDRRAVRRRGARLPRADVLRRRATTTRSSTSSASSRARSRRTRSLLDGERVWPLPDSPFPPSVIRTHGAGRPHA